MIGWLKIAEPSAVAEARRRARRTAANLDFDAIGVEQVAIVATEIAQNVLRHGGGGKMMIESFGAPGLQRLHVLGLDEGPGIARLDRMLKDGQTTRDSPGTGLGAIRRLSDRVDIETAADKGTIVVAEFLAPDEVGQEAVDHAGLRLAYPGERQCGDSVATRRSAAYDFYMVCDGLGHGGKAALAASAARAAFLETREDAPAAILGVVAAALKDTRGAVAAVLRLDRALGQLAYAATGNIATMVVQQGRAKRLPVRDGLLGGQPTSPHVEALAIGRDGLIIMHSDGIATLRGLEQRSPLLHRSAPVIAARLLHESTRGRDDASIVVARLTPSRTL